MDPQVDNLINKEKCKPNTDRERHKDRIIDENFKFEFEGNQPNNRKIHKTRNELKRDKYGNRSGHANYSTSSILTLSIDETENSRS